MGNSQQVSLPIDINDPETRKRYVDSWTTENILSNDNNRSQIELNPHTHLAKITKACEQVHRHIIADGSFTMPMKILDVFCGNMQTTRAMAEKWPGNWMCTDGVDYGHSKPFPFDQLTAPDAVAKYEADVLVLAYPSPYPSPFSPKDLGYADYYACVDFAAKYKNSSTPHYIVFLGELGAAEGSNGMYDYLHEFRLVTKELIEAKKDMFGGDLIRYAYVFRV